MGASLSPVACYIIVEREAVMANGRGGAAAGASGGLYGLGFLGAAIYLIGHAATFGAGVLGFLKACVWPVFLIYKLMEHLGM
jgi:hypothetical protein